MVPDLMTTSLSNAYACATAHACVGIRRPAFCYARYADDFRTVAVQVSVLIKDLTSSKAAAQAAAEGAAHDVAALSSALMCTEGRCTELESAHAAVRHRPNGMVI